MTAKAANARLYIATIGLVAAVLSLLGALVLLASSAAAWLAARVQAHAEAPVARPAHRAPARLAAVRRPTDGAVRLTVALTGLGFHAPDVRRFVGSLGDRVDSAPLETLIKDGLRVLAPAVAS